MFEIIAYADSPCEYRMYEDDGITNNFTEPENYVPFEIVENEGVLTSKSPKKIVKLTLY